MAWPEDDQDKALAYLRRERRRCAGCGTFAAEWDADRFAYVGDIRSCPGCEVLEQEQSNIPEAERGRHWKLSLVPRPIAEARVREQVERGELT